ncbi:O-antigen ligase family protein [Tsuneonella dongtanensis]|uniref:O-antigen ligase family protein n=1 Tax=Tsuneonella dongtanensis TaxID=692370 RepID=UPI0018DDCE2B|nr:O-antigen ligase family protein [Tsuneonella dongtanensis]
MSILLALAVAIGGGGANAPWGNLVVQLAAIAALAVRGKALAEFATTSPRALTLLVAASCLFPLVQLVPLHPDLWRDLPGRSLVAGSQMLSGGLGWFPLSLSPARTLVAFLGTLAPLAVMVLAMRCSPRELAVLQSITVCLAIAAAAFGTLHLFNDEWGDLYASQRPLAGVLVATFADRNAAALALVGALLFLVGLPAPARTAQQKAIRAAAGAFLATCVVLTGSRSGMVLLAAPALLFAWRLAGIQPRADRHAGNSRRSMTWAAAFALLALAGAAAILTTDRAQETLDRFDGGDGMRAEMRADSLYAAQRYWPVGAGMGTFDEVFQVDESLEHVSPRRAGRAHMDYLELAIEGGLVAVLIAAAWIGWVILTGWRAIRTPDAWSARAALLFLAAIAAQSTLAYPLRNQAMLCLGALAVALLARSPIVRTDRGPLP